MSFDFTIIVEIFLFGIVVFLGCFFVCCEQRLTRLFRRCCGQNANVNDEQFLENQNQR